MELAVIFTTLAVTFTDEGLRFIAAGLVMGLGALATPLGIGRLVASATEALPAIQTNMILGVAFCEAIAIYSLIVAIMIGFVF
jgi:F-type H+-transporting ATPase subunit c